MIVKDRQGQVILPEELDDDTILRVCLAAKKRIPDPEKRRVELGRYLIEAIRRKIVSSGSF